MVPISSRRLLVAGGITAAAGCTSSAPERRSDDATELDADPGATVAVEWTAAGETAEVTSGRASRKPPSHSTAGTTAGRK